MGEEEAPHRTPLPRRAPRRGPLPRSERMRCSGDVIGHTLQSYCGSALQRARGGGGGVHAGAPPPPIAVIRPLRRQASPPSLPLALPRAPVADSWKHTLQCPRVRAGGRQVAVADLRGNKQRRNVSRVRRLHSAARRAVFSWAPHAPPPGRRGGGWDGRMTTAERQVAGGGRAAAGSRAEGVAGVS